MKGVDDIRGNIELIMKPDKLRVFGKPVRLIYCKERWEVDKESRHILDGQYDPINKTARIRAGDRTLQDIWHSIIHELWHMVEHELGLNIDHEVLDFYSLAMTDLLFSNRIFSMLTPEQMDQID